MLRACGISMRHGRRTVLKNINVDVSSGEIVAICGPNGAGKSTLLAILGGGLLPTEGKVEIQNVPIKNLKARDLAFVRAFLEQNPQITAPFSVRELVMFGISCVLQPSDGSEKIVDNAIHEMGLSSIENQRVDRLSGGELARAQFARVTVQIAASRLGGGGGYLLLDEPTASLDLSHQISAMRAARKIAKSGSGVLVAVHDLNLAAVYAERVVLIKSGSVVADAPPKDVFTKRILEDVYGVRFNVYEDHAGIMRVIPFFEE